MSTYFTDGKNKNAVVISIVLMKNCIYKSASRYSNLLSDFAEESFSIACENSEKNEEIIKIRKNGKEFKSKCSERGKVLEYRFEQYQSFVQKILSQSNIYIKLNAC